MRQVTVLPSVAQYMLRIVEATRSVLERISPDLAADLLETGIVMTGGGALLEGLDGLLARKTGLPVRVAANAATAVVEGCGRHVSSVSGHDASLVSGCIRLRVHFRGDPPVAGSLVRRSSPRPSACILAARCSGTEPGTRIGEIHP